MEMGTKTPKGWYALRLWVIQRDNHTCQYCGAKAPEVKIEVDHRWPRVLGGNDEPGNLKAACWECNRGKGARPDPTLTEEEITRFNTKPAAKVIPRFEPAPVRRVPTITEQYLDFMDEQLANVCAYCGKARDFLTVDTSLPYLICDPCADRLNKGETLEPVAWIAEWMDVLENAIEDKWNHEFD